MTKVSIILLPQSKNSEIGRICKMISDKGKVQRPSIGFNIPISDWCDKTKRVKNSNSNSMIINTAIENIINGIENQDINYNDCIISFMENHLKTGYSDKSIKYSTFKKYNTIAKSFRKAMKVLGMVKITLNDVLDKQKLKTIISIVSINNNPSGKRKTTLNNYLVVFSTFVKKWHQKNNGNPMADFSFIHKDSKRNIPGHANYFTSEELITFEGYVPKGRGDLYIQTITKSIFLSQYHIGGIRISDILTLTNSQFKTNGIEIRMRKNDETRTYPYSYELVLALRPLYPIIYSSVIENLNLGSIKLPATIVAAMIRSGINVNHYNLEVVNQKISLLENSLVVEHKSLIEELQKLKRILQDLIKEGFFRQIQNIPEGFIFPMLDYNKFKEYLDEPDFLDKDLSYAIHRATCKYNSNLKIICKWLGINRNLTSHSPRHSIALHLMERGATTPIIQDVLGQRNLSSTAVYLQQRLPSNNIGVGMGLIHNNTL